MRWACFSAKQQKSRSWKSKIVDHVGKPTTEPALLEVKALGVSEEWVLVCELPAPLLLV